MPKIAILPQQLVNKIAAGEVVERPASVLKEFLENSLDAGATSVNVEIAEGGRKFIKVSDNACGMDSDDLALAFTPHATSKIACDDDLFSIATLGFRGEALASIASVSQVEVLTRAADAIEGLSLRIAAGQAEPIAPAAAAPGTAISVSNLFYNVPARRKFLKAASTEMGHLAEQFIRIALPHRNVKFTLTHNGRVVHDLPPDQSLRQRISTLFSSDLADDLLSIERNDRGVGITGLIAPPQRTRANTQSQYIFLNGRYIRDRFIGHAIREAYRGLLEGNRQPIVFLFIKIDPSTVDINVHPAKIEVRFADSNTVHSQVLAAIRDKLLSTDLSVPLRQDAVVRAKESRECAGGDELPEDRHNRIREAMADFFKNSKPTANLGPYSNQGQQSNPIATNVREIAESPSIGGTCEAGDGKVGDTVDVADVPQVQDVQSRSFMQVHNAYIVAETRDGIVIVDQHALHERIIYEQLYAQLKAGKLACQRRLIPETVSVTPKQMAALEQSEHILTDLGIIAEEFGPSSIAIQGLPILLEKVSPAEFVVDLLDIIVTQHGKVEREELFHSLLDMMACKAAVKAGDHLTQAEIQSLLSQRDNVERACNCPHGRPTTISLTLTQLEKQFKRT